MAAVPEMPFPWPEVPAAEPEQPYLSRHERRRIAGPIGGHLSDPVQIADRRAKQKAQRLARRRNRHG